MSKRSEQYEFKAGTILANRYRVGRPLGYGGMGEVYEVTDLFTEKRFALKTIKATDSNGIPRPWQGLASRFQLEAKISAHLRDPTSVHEGRDRIVTLLHYALLPDGRPFAVMDLLSGLTLSSYLLEHKRAKFTTACQIARELCIALDYLHEHGVVHRDVKGENIFLEPGAQLRVFLSDLGVAKLIGEPPERALTGGGYPVGTPGMIPRESYLGKAPSPETDMFAVGILIFQMITGRTPWAHLGEDGLRMILSDRPPRAPLLTEFLENFGEEEVNFASQVDRCLRHKAEERIDAATMAVASEKAERGVRKRDTRHAAVEVNATLEDDSKIVSTMIEKAASEQAGAPPAPAFLPSIIVEEPSSTAVAGPNLASMTTLPGSEGSAPPADPAMFPVVVPAQPKVATTLRSSTATSPAPHTLREQHPPGAIRETPAPVSRTVDPDAENPRRRNDRAPTPDPAVPRNKDEPQQHSALNDGDTPPRQPGPRTEPGAPHSEPLVSTQRVGTSRQDRMQRIALRALGGVCAILLAVIGVLVVRRLGATSTASVSVSAEKAAPIPVAPSLDPTASATPPPPSVEESRPEATRVDAAALNPPQASADPAREASVTPQSTPPASPARASAPKAPRAKARPTSVQEIGF